MAIITISRGTFSGGQALAECVAERLGYRCVSREVLIEAARQYGVPEEKLFEALRKKPRILERLSLERTHYLAYIRAVLCEEVKGDNVVYHGHAGHLLLKGIPHVFKVKVIANMEFRIKAAMDRHHLGREEAIQFIKRVDDERVKWTRFLYGVDWNDPSLYDIVINLDHISLFGACEVVCHTAGLEEYKTMPASQKIMDDLVLSTHVRAIIAADESTADAEVEVEADDGIVTIWGRLQSMEDIDRINEIVRKVPGVKEVNSKMRLHWLMA